MRYSARSARRRSDLPLVTVRFSEIRAEAKRFARVVLWRSAGSSPILESENVSAAAGSCLLIAR